MTTQLPSSKDAEAALISCVLIDGAQTLAIASARGITPKSFFLPANATIWARLVSMLADGRPIDLTALCEEMQRHREIDAVGGFAYIADLSKIMPTTARADYFSERVAELAALRDVIFCARQIEEAAIGYTGGGIGAAFGEPVQKLLGAVCGATEPEKNWSAVVDQAGEIADTIIANKGKPSGMVIEFPWAEMNQTFQPMERGQLVVIAARSSVGKSSLVRPIAMHAAKCGHPVYFVTLEVNPEKLPLQLAATMSGIPINGLGRAHHVDQQSFKQALVSLRALGVTVSRKDKSIAQIVSRAKAIQSKQPLGLIVIDHGGQVSDVFNAEYKQDVIGRMTKTFKQLAGELNCVVVLLWQLNRSSVKEDNREPKSHDLRDCGALEEDADKVILIHRPNEDPLSKMPQADNDRIQDRPTFFQNVIQSKGRDDGGSTLSFYFRRETATFIPITKQLSR